MNTTNNTTNNTSCFDIEFSHEKPNTKKNNKSRGYMAVKKTEERTEKVKVLISELPNKIKKQLKIDLAPVVQKVKESDPVSSTNTKTKTKTKTRPNIRKTCIADEIEEELSDYSDAIDDAAELHRIVYKDDDAEYSECEAVFNANFKKAYDAWYSYKVENDDWDWMMETKLEAELDEFQANLQSRAEIAEMRLKVQKMQKEQLAESLMITARLEECDKDWCNGVLEGTWMHPPSITHSVITETLDELPLNERYTWHRSDDDDDLDVDV